MKGVMFRTEGIVEILGQKQRLGRAAPPPRVSLMEHPFSGGRNGYCCRQREVVVLLPMDWAGCSLSQTSLSLEVPLSNPCSPNLSGPEDCSSHFDSPPTPPTNFQMLCGPIGVMGTIQSLSPGQEHGTYASASLLRKS